MPRADLRRADLRRADLRRAVLRPVGCSPEDHLLSIRLNGPRACSPGHRPAGGRRRPPGRLRRRRLFRAAVHPARGAAAERVPRPAESGFRRR
ncbi:pentapeptide repeat-containing protein [Nonomuraea ceibae]|uniref:pentapeptide repeat-containing protein n=1 Tax=Nonomuraea ceibae TaxID=1935170 RepID=UPI0035574800